jgi:hypothetical protein
MSVMREPLKIRLRRCANSNRIMLDLMWLSEESKPDKLSMYVGGKPIPFKHTGSV